MKRARVFDRVDDNDLTHVKRLGFSPVEAVPCPIFRGRIHPTTTLMRNSDGSFVQVFHVKPAYYLHQNGGWRPLSEVTAHHGNRHIRLREGWDEVMDLRYVRWLMKRCALIGGALEMPFPSRFARGLEWRRVREGVEMFFTTDTFYPDPNPETTTVDGYVYSNTDELTYDNKRSEGSTSATADDTATNAQCCQLRATVTTDKYDILLRSVYLFNTGPTIPSGNTISSATLSIYGVSLSNTMSQNVGITSSAPGSNTAVQTTDYPVANYGNTEFATSRIAVGSWSTTGYNDFSLNASGISNIAKGSGVSKFSCRLSSDIDNVAPTWSSGATVRVNGYYADQTGTANDPKLVVTHAAASANPAFLLNFCSG